MKCVVTGAAGFVGSSITDELLAKGHEVVGVDCFVDYYPRQIKERNLSRAMDHNNFTFREEDLAHADCRELLYGADWVFHQAAQAGVRASWGNSFSIYTDNNILATQRLLEAARDHEIRATLKKIVYASSSSIYGNAETLPTSELTLPQPVSPYGVSKLAAEHLMVLYAKEFGLPTVSLRYFTVYGPRQRPDMAIHRFIRSGLTGDPCFVFGDGEQTRDFTFIKDIVRANLAAAETPTNELVFNIGGGARVGLRSVIGTIEELLGHKLPIEFRSREAGDARHTGADISRARSLLKYEPQVSIRDGLAAEIEWLGESLS